MTPPANRALAEASGTCPAHDLLVQIVTDTERQSVENVRELRNDMRDGFSKLFDKLSVVSSNQATIKTEMETFHAAYNSKVASENEHRSRGVNWSRLIEWGLIILGTLILGLIMTSADKLSEWVK